MRAGEFIYTTLKNNATVNAIVGTGDNCRVFPLVDNQSFIVPFITYQTISTTANATKSGVSLMDIKTIQINIVGATPLLTTVLAEAVRTALDYTTNVGIQQCYFDSERDDWQDTTTNDGACMIQQDYKLLINR
jgi:hypothetical protein